MKNFYRMVGCTKPLTLAEFLYINADSVLAQLESLSFPWHFQMIQRVDIELAFNDDDLNSEQISPDREQMIYELGENGLALYESGAEWILIVQRGEGIKYYSNFDAIESVPSYDEWFVEMVNKGIFKGESLFIQPWN